MVWAGVAVNRGWAVNGGLLRADAVDTHLSHKQGTGGRRGWAAGGGADMRTEGGGGMR